MHMKKTAKFVLLLDCDSTALQTSAMTLTGTDGYLLIARTPAAAVEFAKQYKPAYLVVAKSHATTDGKSLQELVLEFSPETEMVVISDLDAVQAMRQGA